MRLYIPVQDLYQLVRSDVVVYQVVSGYDFYAPHKVEYVRGRTCAVYPCCQLIYQICQSSYECSQRIQ